MMPAPAYLHYARQADHHLQVRINERTPAPEQPFMVRVDARVERVFKSKVFRPGDDVRFSLKTYREPDYPPPDAGGWVESESLKSMLYLEVLLNGEPGNVTIAAFGALHRTIAEPSETHAIKVPSMARLLLARLDFWLPFPLPLPRRWLWW